MQLFYDKQFLERAKAFLVHDIGAQRKGLKKNSGKSIVWNRFTPLALATTPLTEGTSNPSETDMSTTVVSTTVATYGKFTRVTDLFEMTSLDENLMEHVDVMAQNAGETLDALIRNELSAGGTAQIVSGKVLTDVAATDVISGVEIRKAVRTLKTNKAQRFENGLYRGIIQPFQSYDLMGNTEWLNSQIYTNPEDMKRGVVGRLHGVEFVETNQGSTEASTVTVYHTFIFGKNAYGTVKLEGQPDQRIYVKNPGEQDTSNPLNIFSTVGWKAFFAVKTLNANWLIVLKTGATA